MVPKLLMMLIIDYSVLVAGIDTLCRCNNVLRHKYHYHGYPILSQADERLSGTIIHFSDWRYSL